MSINDYRDPDWVAEKLGLDKNTVYKFLQDGTIPAIQLGRKWLISEAELGQWLDAQTREQTQARRQAACSVERTVHRMDNFSAEARQALKSAHSEARRYAHRYLGQEHLLLAMVAQADSAPAGVLRAAGLDIDKLRWAVEARLPAGQGPVPRRLARDPAAKAAMRAAEREALAAGISVGTGELLLGILRSGNGPGYEILAAAGLTAEQALAALGHDQTADKE